MLSHKVSLKLLALDFSNKFLTFARYKTNSG